MKYAIVFPGQGSQSVGMLSDVAAQYPIVADTFAEASDQLGYHLWDLVQQGPAETLDQTAHTQPALLTASYAVWRILRDRLPNPPTLLAGHSLGEYTALVCANSISFADAVKLVAARGCYMQEAVRPGEGAMAAIIGLDDEAVASLCRAESSPSEVLAPANYNAIGQVVIAGHVAAVKRAMDKAKEQGAKMAVLIPVSVPSHCALMRDAAQRLAELLRTISISRPTLPVINNVDVISYQDEQSIRDGLVRQLFSPVRWVGTIQTFANEGVTRIIECGPGKVLTGLNKRIDKTLDLMTTSDLTQLEALHVD